MKRVDVQTTSVSFDYNCVPANRQRGFQCLVELLSITGLGV